MFCSKCGTTIEDDAKFCPKCGNQIVAEPQESFETQKLKSEKTAVPKKKSKVKFWLWLGAGVLVLRVICAVFTSDGENTSVKKSSPSHVPTVERKADPVQEIQNAREAIKWVKGRESMTELQREAAFKKLKDQWAVFKGEVREVGEKMFGGTFVSLKVDRLNEIENVNVEIVMPDTLKETVSGWSVGETHVLRGYIKGTGDLQDDISCSQGEIVDEADYKKYATQADQKTEVEVPRQSEPDARLVPSTSTAHADVDLKSEIENAKAAINWIKSKEKMTELQQEASFKKLVGRMVVFKGEVREVGEKMLGGDVRVPQSR